MLSDDYDGFFEVYKKKKVQKDFFVTCLGLQKANNKRTRGLCLNLQKS